MASIFDCDMHPMASGVDDFLPYLQGQAWRERFSSNEFTLTGRATDRYYHPAGSTLRADTVPPGGGLPGSDPVFAKTDYLDRYDIGAALMLPMQGAAVGAWTDPKAGDVFSTASNDYFNHNWAQFDSRYKLAITVSPLDPVSAAREIRRHKDDRGVLAVSLPLLNVLMGNPHYYPIYEAAVECGMPIIVHPSGTEGCYTSSPVLAGGVPRGYAERRSLFPQVAWSNIASLIFEGVFERYKDLKVVMCEFGFSWALSMLWRMDSEWRSFRSELPWLTMAPSEYAFDKLRFTTQPMDEPDDAASLWAIMEMMNAQRTVMFSTDYPHWDIDEPDVVVRRIPQHLRQPLTAGNAQELFAERL